jgi:hypothetical protein
MSSITDLGGNRYLIMLSPTTLQHNPPTITINLSGLLSNNLRAEVLKTIEVAVQSTNASPFNRIVLGNVAEKNQGREMRLFEQLEYYGNITDHDIQNPSYRNANGLFDFSTGTT